MSPKRKAAPKAKPETESVDLQPANNESAQVLGNPTAWRGDEVELAVRADDTVRPEFQALMDEIRAGSHEPFGDATLRILGRYEIDTTACKVVDLEDGHEMSASTFGLFNTTLFGHSNADDPAAGPDLWASRRQESEIVPTEVSDARELLSGDGWTTVDEHAVTYPSGATRQMRVSHNRSSVVVVAMTEDGYLPVVKQWKHAAGRIFTEFPAGYLEHEFEGPVRAGMRELAEETGYASQRWLYLGQLYREPGVGRTVVHVCLALGAEWADAQALDETERIQYELVDTADVDEMLRDGRMQSMLCAAAWGLVRPYVQKELGDA